MFGFGDRKTKLEKLHRKLSDQAYRLSHTDRRASDLKQAEAAEVLKQIEALEKDSTQSSA